MTLTTYESSKNRSKHRPNTYPKLYTYAKPFIHQDVTTYNMVDRDVRFGKTFCTHLQGKIAIHVGKERC
jgi:hypothetical protein